MKHQKICLAIASALLVSGAAMTQASAAGPAPQKAAILHAAADAGGGARIIVKYRNNSAERRDTGTAMQVVTSALNRAMPARAGASSRGGAAALQARHLRRMAVGADVVKLSRSLNKVEMTQLLSEIAADPSVEYAELDQRVYPLLTPNDPDYANFQWNFFNPAGGVNAPQAWDIAKGAGVVVAVIDTGILPDHPDLVGQSLPGYDFITDAFVSRRDTDDRAPGAFDYGDWNPVAGECSATSTVRNSSWHGSHVAGTIAQVTDNAIGVAGLAFESTILPIRALGRCGGYTSDIADAIVWASGGDVDGVPTNQNPAEVINLSLGGGQACPSISQDAVDIANANGSLVVVAAGNSNGNVANFSPASCNGVVSVGATRITGGRASYSNYGALVDLSGPGGGGSQDTGNNQWDGFIRQSVSASTTAHAGVYGYGGKAGTSMAAPHVAAVAAMVQGALVAADRAPLAPADLETLLKDSARAFPVPIPADTPMGTGIVDALAALELALEEPCDPAVDVCEPEAPEAIALLNKVPLRGLSGAAGSEVLYAIEVPEGITGPLSITTSGGSGDVSLHVSLDEAPGESGQWNSTRPGNSETVRINNPAPGVYYVKLSGVRAYSNVTLQARHNEPPAGPGPGDNELENGVPVTGITGAAGSDQFWTIQVPAGTASLTVGIAGATGDADLYVRQGAQPTDTAYACRPYLSGSTETCTLANPVAGTWHIRINAFETFDGLTLTGSF